MRKPLFSQISEDMRSQTDMDKILDQILKTDVMIPLPEDFADRIARKAVKRMALKQSLTEFLVYAGVIVSGVVTVLVVIYFSNRENWIRWTDFLTSNINYVTGAAMTMLFILFMDRVFLPMIFLKVKSDE